MKNFDLPIKIEAIVYFRDKESKYFLAIQRSEEDGGFWQPVTGTLEAADTIEGCLLREIEEEIGIRESNIISISEPIHHFIWNKKLIGNINEYVFAVEVKKDSKIILSSEHIKYIWGTKEEIRSIYKMTENQIAINKI